MNDITFEDILTCAKTVYGEARGEPHQGRLAVAWVIRNRWESDKWFGRGSIKDVCLRPYQFSCWNADDPNQSGLMKLSPDNSVLQVCLYAAVGALRGMEADPTMGATHYFAYMSAPVPKWAVGKHFLSIGGHRFYSDID